MPDSFINFDATDNEAPKLGIEERLSSINLWKFCSAFWLFGSISSAINQMLRNDVVSLIHFLGYWFAGLPWWIGTLLLMPLLVATSCFIAQQFSHIVAKLLLYIGLILVAVAVQTSLGSHLVLLIDTLFPALDPIVIPNIQYALIYYSSLNLWHIDLQMYVLYVLLGIAWQWYEASMQAKVDKEKLMAKVIESDLIALRAQLNPHFLFNVLNGIVALVRTDRKSTALKSLSNLSVLLRGILEQPDSSFCQIKDELALVNVYMQMQQLRYGDELHYSESVSDAAREFYVPTFLLLPLIENAIEHGAKKNCVIELSLDVEQVENQDTLLLQVSNNLDQNELSRSDTGFGIGLGNNVNRLTLIYGETFSIEKKQNQELFSLSLRLPDIF